MAEIIGYGTFFTWIENVPVKVLCQRPNVGGKRDFFAEILHGIRKAPREPTYDPGRKLKKPRQQPAKAEKKARKPSERPVAALDDSNGGLPQDPAKRSTSAAADPVRGQSTPPAGDGLRQMVFPGCELPPAVSEEGP